MNEISTLIEYDRKRNKLVLECWGIIFVVLFMVYLVELFKGNVDLKYIISYFLVMFIPFTLTLLYARYFNYKNLSIKHIVSLSYLGFYAYAMFTTKSNISFILIFPIISILVIYMDSLLILIDYGVALFINVLCIIKEVILSDNLSNNLIMYELQVVCLILSGVFLYKMCNVLKYSYNYLVQLDKDVDTDALTLVKNRYFLNRYIKLNFNSKDKNTSLAVIDIDNFKEFNDTYGHNFGDLVLRKVAKLLCDNVSELKDYYVVRTGGDEFLIIANNISELDLYNICVKICNSASTLVLKYNNKPVSINLSIGVANTLDDSCFTFEDLYSEADSQLYVAKNNGKNSVVHKERFGIKE